MLLSFLLSQDEKAKRERREKILRNRERKQAIHSHHLQSNSSSHACRGGGSEEGIGNGYSSNYGHYQKQQAEIGSDYGPSDNFVSGATFHMPANRQPPPTITYWGNKTSSGSESVTDINSSNTYHQWFSVRQIIFKFFYL